MNNPYHASNIISSNENPEHHNYEQWVKNNVGYVSIYNDDLSETGTGTYRYMYDNKFLDISNHFVSLAKQQLTACRNFGSSPAAANTATVTLLARTERAVVGVLNRYYYYGWLNH